MDDSISTQLIRLRNKFSELLITNENQNHSLNKIQEALGGDDDTTMLQIQKLRAEQLDNSKDLNKNIEWIVEFINQNNKLITGKFDEFSELLARNNTEALVDVMTKATEEFNSQMSSLIEKLVQEAFKN